MKQISPIAQLSRAGLVFIVTGGIASGKSFILKHFVNMGYQAVSADQISHKFFDSDGAQYKKLLKSFPDCINAAGKLDRSMLSGIVFNDKVRLKELNDIMHPLIRNRYEMILKSHYENRSRSIVFEVPLAVESIIRDNYFYQTDQIILVTASYQTRLKRALLRNNMTVEKFDAILSAQLSDSVRVLYADFVIHNERGSSALSQVERFLHGKFKRNSTGYRNNWS